MQTCSPAAQSQRLWRWVTNTTDYPVLSKTMPGHMGVSLTLRRYEPVQGQATGALLLRERSNITNSNAAVSQWRFHRAMKATQA